jgi:hypothetical protein
VSRFNGRHLDQNRRLLPRDYAADPFLFGVDEHLEFHVPEGGNKVSMLVAAEQHRLVCDWSRIRLPSSAAVLARRYGTSPQTLSTVVTGRRWAGETLLAALSDALRAHDNAARTPPPRSEPPHVRLPRPAPPVRPRHPR